MIGREDAGVLLAGERFCHAREAVVRWKDEKLWLEDIEGGCGVFVRIKTPVELEIGDEFIIGDQLARILENPVPDVGPGPGPTYFYSSPTWLSSFRVVQIYEGEREGACVVARGTTVVVGRSVADLVFASDPLVAEQHCIVEEQAGTIVLTDLESRTGVFVRVKGEHELAHGDEILVGRTRLMVDLHVGAAACERLPALRPHAARVNPRAVRAIHARTDGRHGSREIRRSRWRVARMDPRVRSAVKSPAVIHFKCLDTMGLRDVARAIGAGRSGVRLTRDGLG